MLRNKNGYYSFMIRKSIKRSWLFVFTLSIFLLVSFLFISPETRKPISNYHSSQLTKVTKQENDKERVDYVNSDGIITIAADLGYATMIVTKQNNGRTEAFYDAQGEPVRRNNGYYAVYREYDKNGNNTQNVYLDQNGEPVMTSNGYAKEERIFNENNQLIKIRYFDVCNNPVCSPYFGYGRINLYDKEGRNYCTTYIDSSGNPMVAGLGYASIVRQFYTTDNPEKDKVENEYYYDEKGDPIKLKLGQYGVHKEYNKRGKESALTYLDADGEPMVTNKGYTTVTYTYHADNSVATELYFDLNGDPYALSEGQFGIKRENGHSVYLNQNGNEKLNIRTILYNNSWIVIIICVMILMISSMLTKEWNIILLFLCFCIIIYLTLMFRNDDIEKRVSFFLSYRRIFINSEARSSIIKNIWLFIPLGAILYQLYPKRIVLFIPFFFSTCIEGLQYITGIGFSELDDIISNSVGAGIGFYAGKLTTGLIQRIKYRKHI